MTTADRPWRRVRRRRRRAGRRRRAAEPARRAGRLARRSSPTTAAAHRAGRRAPRRRCRPGIELSYAVKANPMPAVVQHLAGSSTRIDVASACEMRAALDTPMPPHRISFAGPGKTHGRDRAGGRGGRHHRAGVGDRGPARARRSASELGLAPRVAHPGQPGLRGQGLRDADGRRSAAVRHRRRAGAGAAGRACARPDLDMLGFHVFAGSQNLHAEHPRARRSGSTVELAARAGRASARGRYATSTSAAGSGSRTSTRTRPLDLAPSATTSHDLLDRADPTAASRTPASSSSSADTSSARPAST